MTNQNKERNKPRTEVVLKHKENQSVTEFAQFLEMIAAKLKEEGSFTFIQGEDKVPIQPTNQLKVGYEYEVKGDRHSFEIEFDWYTGDKARKPMDIE